MTHKPIAEVIREELRLCGLLHEPGPALPPPMALDVEADVCSAVLNEYVRPEQLGLVAGDFYARLHAYVWVCSEAVIAAGMRPSVASVLAAFDADGIKGPRLEQELEQLRDAQPFVCVARLQDHAATLRELRKRRELVRLMAELDAELRLGRLSHDGARQRLREHYVGAQSHVRAA